jgi:hypothetical protein
MLGEPAPLGHVDGPTCQAKLDEIPAGMRFFPRSFRGWGKTAAVTAGLAGHSDHFHGTGARSLGASFAAPLIDLVFHGLAFSQLLEALILHDGVMEKDIPSFAGNKTESPIRDHFLDRTLRHGRHSWDMPVRTNSIGPPLKLRPAAAIASRHAIARRAGIKQIVQRNRCFPFRFRVGTTASSELAAGLAKSACILKTLPASVCGSSWRLAARWLWFDR